MTDHPITPPPELVQQWMTEARSQDYFCITEQVAHRAAQWGADQELEACCRELEYNFMPDSGSLRAARRPKPPNLKEQALHALGSPTEIGESRIIGHRDHDLLRRALEALPDD